MTFPPLESFKGPSYRNIYTAIPSVDPFDDLELTQDEREEVRLYENETSGIDHNLDQKHRAFQYGDVETSMGCFDEINAGGRFNANFGVWYGALEEETSIYESLYHFYQDHKQRIHASNADIVVDRKMFEAQLQSNAFCDLRKSSFASKLTQENYAFTQKLGKKAKQEKIEGFLTPSARAKKGVCTPVFFPNAIANDQIIYFLQFRLEKDTLQLSYAKRGKELKFNLPKEWE